MTALAYLLIRADDITGMEIHPYPHTDSADPLAVGAIVCSRAGDWTIQGPTRYLRALAAALAEACDKADAQARLYPAVVS